MAPSVEPTVSFPPTISVAPSEGPTHAPTRWSHSHFSITLDVSRVGVPYRSAFQNAQRVWESIIRNDITDGYVSYDVSASVSCTLPWGSYIDDLFLCAIVKYIDGYGGILGSAGPRMVRYVNGKWYTLTGAMTLDSYDVSDMADDGILEKVIVSVKKMFRVWLYDRLIFVSTS